MRCPPGSPWHILPVPRLHRACTLTFTHHSFLPTAGRKPLLHLLNFRPCTHCKRFSPMKLKFEQNLRILGSSISVLDQIIRRNPAWISEVSKRFCPQSRKTSGKNGVQWSELQKVTVIECFGFCCFFAKPSTQFSKSEPQISNVVGNSSIFIWFYLYMRGRRVQLKNINAEPQGLLCLL